MRIVSLVPSQTELLHDLGLEYQIVGVTKFCVHPKHYLSTKTRVGGTKQIKIDKIKALNPDIILCNKEENTKDIVEACQEICEVHVSDLYTIDDTIDLIAFYGETFNKKETAKQIVDGITSLKLDFERFIKGKASIKVAYFIWRNPWMVAANNTFIDYMLKLNKFENIYANLERYPEVDITKIQLEGNPDVILLSSEPYPFKDEHALDFRECSPQAKTVFVDGELFSWYGSRLLKAFDYFKILRARL
jgi:ABC-type Fe3+-hydroxamate transport system substrate-binding protein